MPEAPSTHPTFESAWAGLAGRLENALVADRVPRPLAEDIVQETGVRLFERWDRLDTSTSLMPLAITIARNLVVDHYRKDERVELQAAPQQEVIGFDVEERALARVHLGAVHRALRKLNPRYRSLLLAEAGYEKHNGAGGATRTARTRARQGLKLLMDRAPDAAWAASGPIAAFYRRSAFRMRRLFERHEWAALGQVAAAAALLFVASLPPSGAIAEETPGRSTRDRVIAASASKETSHSTVVPRSDPRVTELTGEQVQEDTTPGSTMESTDESVLSLVPHSKGRHAGGGSFGTHGFDDSSSGTATVAGEEVDWKYDAEYRNPECVQEAAEGNVSPGCDTSAHAEGGASVRHRDREVEAETPGGDRS
jgi:hypothetical protein